MFGGIFMFSFLKKERGGLLPYYLTVCCYCSSLRLEAAVFQILPAANSLVLDSFLTSTKLYFFRLARAVRRLVFSVSISLSTNSSRPSSSETRSNVSSPIRVLAHSSSGLRRLLVRSQ